MQKGMLVLTILLCLLLLPNSSFSNSGTLSLNSPGEGQPKLLEIFENSGAAPSELKIEGWKKISEIQPTKKACEEIVRLIVKEFKGETLTQEWTEENNFQSLRVIARIDGGLLTAIAQKIDTEFYLIASVEGTSFTNLTSWQKSLRTIFNYYAQEPELSVNLTGTLPGRLSKEEQYQLVEEVFLQSEAVMLEGIATDNVVSYSGYCPDLKNHLLLKNQKINLNIATRPHSEDELTYIFMGTPLLTCEY